MSGQRTSNSPLIVTAGHSPSKTGVRPDPCFPAIYAFQIDAVLRAPDPLFRRGCKDRRLPPARSLASRRVCAYPLSLGQRVDGRVKPGHDAVWSFSAIGLPKPLRFA